MDDLTTSTDAHVISWGDPTSGAGSAADWLADHGYRSLHVNSPGSFAAGVVFDSGPGTPVQMAVMGDTLAWDEQARKVTVIGKPL